MTFQERIKAYQRKDRQIIVSGNADLRAKFDGKTLGEILQELDADSEPDFIHWGDDNIPGFRVVVNGVEHFFNCSGSLAELFEDKGGFPGDALTLVGRKYNIQRPVMERGIENGVRFNRVKRVPLLNEAGAPVNGADGKPMMQDAVETVESFNIGLPTGWRAVNDGVVKLTALEITAEEAAKLLAGA